MNSKDLRGAKVEDMAPTLLQMLGDETPDGMDGQVLPEVLSRK